METKKEKKRSTHACTYNCTARRTKYSRRLLSILAQNKTKRKLFTTRVCNNELLLVFVLRRSLYTNYVKKQKKKNGAHTHVRTTVQLEERNIHVGCCLFSHNKKKTKIKNKGGVKSSPLVFVLRDSSLYKKKTIKKKRKKRSAHACTHNCAAHETQYSRRLLSILARLKNKK